MSEIVVKFQPGTNTTTVRATQQPALEVKEVAAQPDGRTILTGPPGPPGPAGPPGAARVFEFTQSVPSAMWIVNHNFGFRPNVAVLSPGGMEMLAEVQHVSTNQVIVYFDQPISGLVVCS